MQEQFDKIREILTSAQVVITKDLEKKRLELEKRG